MSKIFAKTNTYIKSPIIFILLFIFYPNVSLLKYFPLLPFLLIKIICSITLIILLIRDNIKEKKIDPFITVVLLFYIYALIITMINNGDLLSAIFENLLFGIGLIALTKLCIIKDKDLFIKVSVFYFLILHGINFLFIFINTSNSSTGWFFDNRNNAFRYTMPLIYFITLYIKDKSKSYKVFSIVVFLSILFIAIYSKALTTTICFLILIPYLIFLSEKEIRFLNIYVYLTIVLITFIVFTIPPINRVLFSPVSFIFGKSETATGRFIIYDEIINSIKSGNIIFGNGIPKFYDYLNETELENVKVVLAHSLYLDIFYKFGILGTTIFILIIKVLVNTINKTKEIFYKNLVSIFIFIILLWAVADEIYIYRLFYYFAFLYYILVCDSKVNIEKI